MADSLSFDVDAFDNAPFAIDALAWDKQGGLLPAIVQDAGSLRVLMLGYMSREALAATLDSGRVTFYSRSRQRLWTKGESSGNTLYILGPAASRKNRPVPPRSIALGAWAPGVRARNDENA